ncbi:MAG TPA: cysteine desulfurase family protein [Lacipirellulaceae bacterium]|jgi:cysteine desulfurase|nr:cysteine desulfurase family protein [Lacipirellulaceae bacterium]
MQLNSDTIVYLDNHATTRVDPRVVEAMLPYFDRIYANPNSVHAAGHEAHDAVETARVEIATAIGVDATEIVFTSGATESNNLAIRGIAERDRRRGNHLISVTTEHKAVLDPLARLARRGYEVTLLDVEQQPSPRAGWLDPQKVADAIREDTCLVSVMLANNEIGIIQPMQEIAAICKSRGVLLHCDATQAVGKILVDVSRLGIDLMSFTAHKIYGPKGIGALYIRRRDPIVRLDPQITGGGQQEGRRSGTLNVPGIVGFAAALKLCIEELPAERPRLTQLRNALASALLSSLEHVRICGPQIDFADTGDRSAIRLPNNLNLSFGNVDGEALLLAIRNLAVSSGAACTSTDSGPSHVLLALGHSEAEARSSLRFGLGRFNTAADIDFAIDRVTAAVKELRKLAG